MGKGKVSTLVSFNIVKILDCESDGFDWDTRRGLRWRLLLIDRWYGRGRLFLFRRFRTGGDSNSFISHFRDGSKVQLVYVDCVSPTVIEITIVEFGTQCFEVGWHGFDPYEFDVSEGMIRNFV